MLKGILNFAISRVKKEDFSFDSRIPDSYIIQLTLIRVISFINGLIRFQKFHIYASPSSSIKSLSLIKTKSNLHLGPKVYIDALSTEGIIFGSNVSIGKYTAIECTGSLKDIGKGLIVGDNVGLGTHGFFGCAGGIRIGDDCIFGNYVSLHSENHNYEDCDIPIRLQGVNRKGIIIGNDCWIGAKVTILDGAIIGDGCVIAAGAVVKGEFPNQCVIGGIPARVLKYRAV